MIDSIITQYQTIPEQLKEYSKIITVSEIGGGFAYIGVLISAACAIIAIIALGVTIYLKRHPESVSDTMDPFYSKFLFIVFTIVSIFTFSVDSSLTKAQEFQASERYALKQYDSLKENAFVDISSASGEYQSFSVLQSSTAIDINQDPKKTDLGFEFKTYYSKDQPDTKFVMYEIADSQANTPYIEIIHRITTYDKAHVFKAVQKLIKPKPAGYTDEISEVRFYIPETD